MNLDAVSLKATIKELTPLILDGVIQKISQLTRLDLLMQIRRPGQTYKLLLRFEQDNAGLGLVSSALPPAEAPTSFVMLLRKHLQGQKIEKIEQRGLERTIRFYIDDKILLLELFNRSNNLYLLSNNGKIMGMLVRDTKLQAQQVGKVYQEAPAPTKPDASLLNFQHLPELLHPYIGQNANKSLSSVLFGLSTPQSKFICRLAHIEPQANLTAEDIPHLAIALDQWQLLSEEEHYQPVLFEGKISPWSLGMENEKTFPSMLQLFNEQTQAPGIEDKRAILQRVLLKAKEKVNSALAKRYEALDRAQAMEAKRWGGELILAYISSIEPKQNELIVDINWDDIEESVQKALEYNLKPQNKPKRDKLSITYTDGQIHISLDPFLSPSENAQSYFKEYHRLKRSITSVQEPINKAREENEFLDELLYSVESATSVLELEDVRRLWAESRPHQQAPQPKATRSIQVGPLGARAYLYKDFKILVGRNPRQNDHLTFKVAALGDIWLHAHNTPGAHVIIKAAGRKISEDVIEAAAILASRHCKISSSTHVEVSYCDVKQLKKPKGSPPGKVLLKSFKTINVSPHSERPDIQELIRNA